MYYEAIVSIEYYVQSIMYVVTKLHIIIVYYVTWLCQLTQIFVSGFTDKLVCIDISYVDVDV